ncbi:hypothetical protein PIB30_079707 [Stylosanthes scabra]|uniref:Uncharacterized protein n=1 Tax=Stylosanthes scabra TaxID=79078 RepID=A0ABU6VUQ6_9FABA|nr:hypothetical protein [Stylosanthes scabra]
MENDIDATLKTDEKLDCVLITRSLRTSGYGGSSASVASTPTGPTEVVDDLREQVQNLTQSVENQGQELQQQRDEVATLKNMLVEWCGRWMPFDCSPIASSSATAAARSSSADDDDDYEDA